MRNDSLPAPVVVDTSGSSISGIVGTQAFEYLKNNRNTARFIILLASDLKSMIYSSNFRQFVIFLWRYQDP